MAIDQGEKYHHLLLHGQRHAMVLFEHLGRPLPPLKLCAGRRVQVGSPELGEGYELAVLGQVEPQSASDRADSPGLSGASHPRH